MQVGDEKLLFNKIMALLHIGVLLEIGAGLGLGNADVAYFITHAENRICHECVYKSSIPFPSLLSSSTRQ